MPVADKGQKRPYRERTGKSSVDTCRERTIEVMDQWGELRTRITRLTAGHSGVVSRNGVMVISAAQVTEPLGTVTEPVLAVVAQGAKSSVLGERVFDYGAGQYLVVAVDLPLTSHVTRATEAEPFLAFGLPLEAAVIAELLLEAGPSASEPDEVGIAVSDVDEDLVGAVVRLLRLQDSPKDFQVLGPAVKREIHWRLMNGPQGALVRQIGLAGGRVSLVTQAVRWIQARYDQVIRIEDLAAELGLSVSSLNRYFRAVTATSPLQYQKQVRLQRARIQLLTSPEDVATIGYTVGYDSPSHFSREYHRMFGAPPGEDITRLRNTKTVVE
jgi:AraC-like DNA-binding protein